MNKMWHTETGGPEGKVSIVLPVYNGEKYLSESVRSVLAQTWRNWELIIVNDCSTDHTLDICRDFQEKDPRIRVVSNERNLKLPKTLNAGFALATGEYLTWTSDDNAYRPDALAEMVKALEEHPEAVMVYCDFSIIDSEGTETKRVYLEEPEYLVTNNICGACFLYTAKAAGEAGEYDPDLFLAEDYDYWIRLRALGKLIHLDRDLYRYRMHGASLTETKKEQINRQTYRMLEKHFSRMYEDAGRDHLCYSFFDQLLECSEENRDAERKKLTALEKGYAYYLMKRDIRDRLRGTVFHRLYRRMKG